MSRHYLANKVLQEISIINIFSMLFSCHVRVLEWTYTLQLPECQGTVCVNQAWNLKFSDSNGIRTHNHLVPKWTLNHLAKLISSRIAQTKNIYGICWPKRCILFNSIIWKSSKKIACMSNDCGPRIFTKISKVTFFCSQKNRFFVCRICWSFISTGG